MSNPDNKYCKDCAMYEGDKWNSFSDFRQKYGRYGCSGIPDASTEFPYEYHPHCFIKEPLKTAKEIKKCKIKNVRKIIKKYKSSKKAAEYIVSRWDSI